MNDDNDLRALYLASQEDVHASEQLKERTLELLDDNDAALASAALEPRCVRSETTFHGAWA